MGQDSDTRRMSVAIAVVALAGLAACGGSDPQTVEGATALQVTPTLVLPVTASSASEEEEPDSEHTLPASDLTPSTSPLPNVRALSATKAPAPSTVTLQSLHTSRDYVANAVVATPGCKLGFVQPADATQEGHAPLPADAGGATFSSKQLEVWRSRVAAGPFVNPGDYMVGSPGDWARIASNATAFLSDGEPQITPASGGDLFRAGSKARDAAFYFLLTRDRRHLDAVRRYLLNTATNPSADLTQYCYRYLDGRSVPDAPFSEGGWMLRMAVTYDYVRSDLTSSDRVIIENFLRRNAYWLAANLDWAIESIFPKRRLGDYDTRTGDAAAKSLDEAVLKRQFDTNGSCSVDAGDDPTLYVAYTHVKSNGSLGRPITLVSQRFNNRRSAQAAAVAALGAVLADDEMRRHAQRYFMEWLTYGIYADSADGEYARNGDYCVPKMGVAYSQANIQGALLTMSLGLRLGDRSMLDFRTYDGLFGTESTARVPKSLRRVVKHYLDLSTMAVDKHAHEPWKPKQEPRYETHLGRLEANYYNAVKATDNFQELGMLLYAGAFPDLPIANIILRDPNVTNMRFPAANGNSLSTGAVPWLDQMGAFPAVFLLR